MTGLDGSGRRTTPVITTREGSDVSMLYECTGWANTIFAISPRRPYRNSNLSVEATETEGVRKVVVTFTPTAQAVVVEEDYS